VLGHDRGVDAPANVEIRRQTHESGLAGGHQVTQDLIGHRFVENTLVPVGPHVQLQRLEFQTQLVGNVFQIQHREIRLTGARTQTAELWNLDTDGIISPRLWIEERFKTATRLGVHCLTTVCCSRDGKLTAIHGPRPNWSLRLMNRIQAALPPWWPPC